LSCISNKKNDKRQNQRNKKKEQEPKTMDRIEKIIEEFGLSQKEVEECKDMMHEQEFKERFYRNSESYETVFYDVVTRYIDQRREQ
jgi:hypothetical protein